jgi:hypothetical protein
MICLLLCIVVFRESTTLQYHELYMVNIVSISTFSLEGFGLLLSMIYSTPEKVGQCKLFPKLGLL